MLQVRHLVVNLCIIYTEFLIVYFIEPLEMWLSQMHVASPNTYFQMNLTIVNGGRVSSIAVYGRRETPPTVTNYDWVHIVAKDGRIIEKRSLSSSTGKEFHRF